MRFNVRFLLLAVMPLLAIWAALFGRYGRSVDLFSGVMLAVGVLLFSLPIWAINANDRKVNMVGRDDEPDRTANDRTI